MMRFLVHAKHPALAGVPTRVAAAADAAARTFGCAGPPRSSRSYGFASRKRRASGRACRASCEGGEEVSENLLRKARCSWTMYATRAEHEKFVLRWGYLHQLAPPHRFCSPARRVSGLEAARRHVPDEWQAGTHRASAAAARPRPKKSLDARSLPGRSLLLRLHPRHDAVQLLRPL